jgi:thioredoxin reductase (NADPH)
MIMEEKIVNTIIIGGGAAGLTAGMYLARAKSSVVILDSGTIGGQLVLTHEVANYPGIVSTSGYQLATTMRQQAKSFGCEIKSNITLSDLNLEGESKTVVVNNNIRYKAKSLIIATGGRSRMLNVPGEARLKGKGVSYCATCDGDFFQDKEIFVVGGGNSSLEEAVSLTKYASKVTIIHQFDHFQAFEHAIEEAKKNPKINIILQSKITEFLGDEKLEAIRYQNLETGEEFHQPIDGVFIFIGYEANTDMFHGSALKLNEGKEVMADELMKTNLPGIFVAGDNRAKRFRQITTAVADGTIAALSTLEYLTH